MGSKATESVSLSKAAVLDWLEGMVQRPNFNAYVMLIDNVPPAFLDEFGEQVLTWLCAAAH